MSPAPELWRHSAAAIARAVRTREVSCREVVVAHLERIGDVNPRANAVSVVLEESALALADAHDAVIARGEPLGPLHGVPMTIKENIDLEGRATTHGATALANAVSTANAPHVAQLLSAGAIPIGRTNLPSFGLRWHTDNPLRGATVNPWDATRTPGGSSGGDAVALATGMTPLGNGNDYGGSLRVPSQFCGTCALRPTLGRVADYDSLAPADGTITAQLFAVQGPMARHVEDLRLALGAMSGRDANDPWWVPAPLVGPATDGPIRVSIARAGVVDPGVEAGLQRAALALSDAGYEICEIEPPALDEAAALWRTLVFTEIGAVLLPKLRPVLGPEGLRFLELCLEADPPVALAAYAEGLAARLGIARRWTRFQQRYPLVLAPVCTDQAFPIGRDVENLEGARGVLDSMRFVTPFNLLGLPVAVVPVGLEAGLPQAVQLIGDRYREDMCLAAAEAIEKRVGTLAPVEPRAGS